MDNFSRKQRRKAYRKRDQDHHGRANKKRNREHHQWERDPWGKKRKDLKTYREKHGSGSENIKAYREDIED